MRTVDLLTRKFWRATGRRVDLDGAESWLAAPQSASSVVGPGWLEEEARRLGGHLVPDSPGAGLLPSLDVLDGPGFRAADLHPAVRDFYERTSAWRMEAWSSWSPVFRLGGGLVSRFFGRRVQQLALPMDPLDLSHGLDSAVMLVVDDAGAQLAAGWLRTLRATGDHVFSGCYSSRGLPGSDRPGIHVAFPLEAGNVQVFLRPYVEDGALVLRSPHGRFGQEGAYVVVFDGGAHHAARVPLHETFRIHVDPSGVLHTDHVLKLWSATVVRLHYRMEPETSPPSPGSSTGRRSPSSIQRVSQPGQE